MMVICKMSLSFGNETRRKSPLIRRVFVPDASAIYTAN
jgi:hypothetical protein